ncbi:MAG: S8 family serine peptidase, partial [bacterium]
MKGFYKCLRIAFPVLVILALATASENGQAAKRSKGSQSRNPVAANIVKAGLFSEGRLAIKLKQDIVVLGKSTNARSLNAKLAKHNVYAMERAFPFLANSHKKMADELLRIYILRFDGEEHPVAVAEDLTGDSSVEYAAPLPILRASVTPNDPLFIQQVHLRTIQAEQAWDVVKGEDGNTVIGIVDGGTDWRHEDLVGNIWVNEDEIADNGVDDDNNGFIDDVRGWNFATRTNDPTGRPTQPSNGAHGTAVAGMAGAVNNNSTGGAGSSWNAMIMPINVASTSANNDSTLASFEVVFSGVTYAIDNDADIINGSWGAVLPQDVLLTQSGEDLRKLGQDVIDFGLANGSLF